jgi:type VI secretion system FHA domain protein
MPLLLRITGLPEAEGEKLIEIDTALRIGRAPDNDLVLPDEQRMLSKTHCVIRWEAGRYVLLDTSTNGTLLNESRSRLTSGVAVPLSVGDTIHLGRFNLSVVSIIVADRGGDPVMTRTDLIGPVSNAPAPPSAAPVSRSLSGVDSLLGGIQPRPGGSVDDFLTDAEEDAWRPPASSPAAHPDHTGAEAESFARATPHRESIPADWDPLADFGGAGKPSVRHPVQSDPDKFEAPSRKALAVLTPNLRTPPVGTPLPETPLVETPPVNTPRSAMPPAATPHLPMSFVEVPPVPPPSIPVLPAEARLEETPPEAPPATPGASEMRRAFDHLLSACGLNTDRLSDDEVLRAAEHAGQTLRIAVEGMLSILGTRGLAKQEFGIERTAISRGGNNPMKFAGSLDEAMHLLLCNDLPGLLHGEDAMRQAINDIQSHQLALLSGVESAFTETLRRLDPAAIEAAIPHHLGDSMVPVARKARAWDAFRGKFTALEKSLAEDRGEVFGNAFARAYATAQQAARHPRSGMAEDRPDDI